MNRCFIFAAGTFYGLRERPAPGDFVIAADAGYQTCLRVGVTPDLLLGDFDSMEIPADFSNIRRSPVEKDDTDTMLAIKTGPCRGLRGILPLRRHRRQAPGPYPGQPPVPAVPPPPGGPGLAV